MGILYYNHTYQGFSSDAIKTGYMEWYKANVLKDNFLDNFMAIFSHNVIASLFRIISGVLFAIFPIFNTVDNAVSDSYILVSTTIDNEFYLLLKWWLPHSLIEIPAFVLSSSLGVRVFLSLFKPKDKIQNLILAYKDSIIVFACIILPMLLIAAIMESIIVIKLL